MSFNSLYGRTSKIWSPNDALYLWDRWSDADRDKIPETISENNQNRMHRFFGAVETFSGKALVNKNNKLNTYASLVAKKMDTAYFICLDRNPVYLAQSQLIASRFIHGDESILYGVKFDSNEPSNQRAMDPVKQVCDQVQRHKEMQEQQERLIGKERFIVVKYEDFCADPAKWVNKISEDILGQALDREVLSTTLQPFEISNKRKVDKEIFSKIERTFNKTDSPL